MGDNIDNQSAFLHYFHAKDRVDASDLSSDMPLIVSSTLISTPYFHLMKMLQHWK